MDAVTDHTDNAVTADAIEITGNRTHHATAVEGLNNSPAIAMEIGDEVHRLTDAMTRPQRTGESCTVRKANVPLTGAAVRHQIAYAIAVVVPDEVIGRAAAVRGPCHAIEAGPGRGTDAPKVARRVSGQVRLAVPVEVRNDAAARTYGSVVVPR